MINELFSTSANPYLGFFLSLLAPLFDIITVLFKHQITQLGGLHFSVLNLFGIGDLLQGNYLSIFFQIFRELMEVVAKERVGPVIKAVTYAATALFTLSFVYDGMQIAMGKGGNAQDFVGKLVKFYVITGIALGFSNYRIADKVYDIREGTTKMMTSIFIGQDAGKFCGSPWGMVLCNMLGDFSKLGGVQQMDTVIKTNVSNQGTLDAQNTAAGSGQAKDDNAGLMSLRSMAFGQGFFILSTTAALIINEALLALALLLGPIFIFCLNFQATASYFRNWFSTLITLIFTYATVSALMTFGNVVAAVFNLLSRLILNNQFGPLLGQFGAVLGSPNPEGGLINITQTGTILSVVFGLLIIAVPKFINSLFGGGIAAAANELSSRVSGVGANKLDFGVRK